MANEITPQDGNAPALLDPFSESDFKQLLDSLEVQARALAQEFGFDWNEALAPGNLSQGVPKQLLSVARAGIFDASYYLESNQDIAKLGINPLRHYIEYGDAEGRWPNAFFNPKAYRSFFEEGALHGICTLYHYAVVGEALGLGAPPDFDGQRYLATYPELASWLDRPLAHFLLLGRYHNLVPHHRIKLAANQRVSVREKPALTEPVITEDAPCINIIGPVDKISGLGVSARGYCEGIRLSGFTRLGTMTQPLAFPRQSNIPAEEFPRPPFIEGAPINVVHMNGDTLPLMLEHGGLPVLQAAHNIGVWYWELPTLRPEWYVSLKYFHEFWAPTAFIAETLKSATGKRVTVLPPYLPHLADMKRRRGSSAAGTPYFIYCFDANSILERKNPVSLVKAFQLAFPAGGSQGNVELILKVTYPNKDIPQVNELYESAEQDPRIKLVDDLLSSSDLHDLIANAVAYISPHRSEGLGLTVIEAMAAEVPVITTSFGGLSDFVDETTAWPVDFDLVELPAEYHPYPKGFVWADPKIDSLAQRMRQVVDQPDQAQARASTARHRILEVFASSALIERYKAAVERVITHQIA